MQGTPAASVEPRGWTYGATGAVVIYALLAPFSIQAQLGVWLGLLVCLMYPRQAWRVFAAQPAIAGAVAFYFLIQGIAIVYSQHPLRSLICLRGDWPVLSFPVFLALLQVAPARRWGWMLLLASAALAGIQGIVQHLWGLDLLGRTIVASDQAGRFHAVGNLHNHLTYGGVMMLTLVASLGLLLDGVLGRRPIWFLVALATGAGLLASYARTAWIGAAVAGAWLLIATRAGSAPAGIAAHAGDPRAGRARHGPWRRRSGLLLAAVLLAAVAALLLLSPGLQARILSIVSTPDLPRLRLWGTALRIFSHWPLFGAGLGAFKSHFPLFKLPGSYLATGHPHSDLLNVLVHSGLAGALAYVVLWVVAIRALAGRAARRLGFAVALAFLVAGLAQCYFTDEEPARLLWFLMALAVTAPRAGSETYGTNQRGVRPATARRLEARLKDRLLVTALRFLPSRPGPAAPSPASVHRILVVRQDQRLGNLVLATPFLQALRRAAPAAEIALLVGDHFAELFRDAPWVDRVILERKRWLIRHPFAYPGHLARLGRENWDLAFDLSNPDTHSFYNAFLALASRAPARVGFDHPRSRPALSTVIAPPETECHYSLAPLVLLSALGVSITPPPLRVSDALGAEHAARMTSDPGIVIHPGGRGMKRWPAACFAELARELGRTSADPLTVIGGPAEADLVRAVAGAAAGRARPVPLHALAELAGILRRATLYIGCDAGPVHLAAALGVPTISLFLESHPLRYAPLGDTHMAILLGERARTLAHSPRFPLLGEGGDSRSAPRMHGSRPLRLSAEPTYVSQLTRMRPRLSIPAADLTAGEKVRFVCDQALLVRARPAPPAGIMP